MLPRRIAAVTGGSGVDAWPRVAIVGCGGHASGAILPALRHADVRLMATCDLDEATAERASARFGAPRAYRHVEEMLEREALDAVLVVGPPAMHVEVGTLVLESGLHCFIEKPPGLSLADALRLRDASRQSGRQLMVGFMKRHALAYVKARQIIAGDDFGQPTLLRLNYSHWRWPQLRQHLAFMSTHSLDLARFFMGDVEGGALYKRSIKGNHVIALLLHHRGGGATQLSLNAFEPRVQESLEIAGDSTLIRVDDLTELRFHRRAADVAAALRTDTSTTGLWRPDTTIPIASSDSLVLQGYAGQMAEFSAAIRENRAPSPNIDDGVEAMRLLEAIVAAPEGVTALQTS